jgi:protein SCO1/2
MTTRRARNRGSVPARLLWGLLLGVLGGVIVLWALSELQPGLLPQSPRSGPLDKFGAVADFRLVDQSGRIVGAADFDGRPWVVAFIFTRCGGPCPLMTRAMAGLVDSLGPDAPVRFASITVDPDYDTPEVLAEYAAQFGADTDRWRFLTGSRADILRLSLDSFHLALGDPVWTSAAGDGGEHAAVEAQTSPAPPAPLLVTEADSLGALLDIAHSTRFVLVDARREVRGYYDGTDPGALGRLVHDLERLTGRRR